MESVLCFSLNGEPKLKNKNFLLKHNLRNTESNRIFYGTLNLNVNLNIFNLITELLEMCYNW